MLESVIRAGSRVATGFADPGVLETPPTSEYLASILSLDAEQLPILGLPSWWLVLAAGRKANACLDAGLTLEAAYQVLGIRAVPVFVEVWTADIYTKDINRRAPDTPSLDEQGMVHGHAGLWLPDHHRFVDPTVQQFPEVRREFPAPLVTHLPAGWNDFAASGQMFAVPRGDTLISYRPLPIASTADIVDKVRRRGRELDPPEGHYRAGINVATSFLEALRTVPEAYGRAVTGPYTRIRQLLEAIGTAQIRAKDGKLRIYLASHSGGLLLDEIP